MMDFFPGLSLSVFSSLIIEINGCKQKSSFIKDFFEIIWWISCFSSICFLLVLLEACSFPYRFLMTLDDESNNLFANSCIDCFLLCFFSVAMNYQTAGKFMDVYFGRFLSNGGCGYVLKPTYLRYDNAAAAAAASASSSMVSGRLSSNLYSSNTPQILHIKVKEISLMIFSLNFGNCRWSVRCIYQDLNKLNWKRTPLIPMLSYKSLVYREIVMKFERKLSIIIVSSIVE